MKVQFALCAQTASIDRATNRVSIFNVIDHFPVASLPVLIPALTFVAVIEGDSDDATMKGVLEISAKGSTIFKMDVPINFTSNRLARIVLNFQGIPVREPGPLAFCLTLPDGAAAKTEFQVLSVTQKNAIQAVAPTTE